MKNDDHALVSYPLRLPKHLKQRLEQQARDSGKTLRQILLECIEKYLEKDDMSNNGLAERVANLEQRLLKVESKIDK